MKHQGRLINTKLSRISRWSNRFHANTILRFSSQENKNKNRKKKPKRKNIQVYTEIHVHRSKWSYAFNTRKCLNSVLHNLLEWRTIPGNGWHRSSRNTTVIWRQEQRIETLETLCIFSLFPSSSPSFVLPFFPTVHEARRTHPIKVRLTMDR